ARQLVVLDSFAIFDVDLSEDLFVSIQDHAGRLHLFELLQIEDRGLPFEIAGQNGHVNKHAAEQDCDDGRRHVNIWSRVPGRFKEIPGWRCEVWGGSSQVAWSRVESGKLIAIRRKIQIAKRLSKRPTPNPQHSTPNADAAPRPF